jgi:AcrR family transcriptional regulator
VDAGWDQLIESGYERFTIDAVAERSSSARSVLYRRRPSRLDLLKAVIRHRGQVDSIPIARGELEAMPPARIVALPANWFGMNSS